MAPCARAGRTKSCSNPGDSTANCTSSSSVANPNLQIIEHGDPVGDQADEVLHFLRSIACAPERIMQLVGRKAREQLPDPTRVGSRHVAAKILHANAADVFLGVDHVDK